MSQADAPTGESLLGIIVEASAWASVPASDAGFRNVVEAMLALGSASALCHREGSLVYLAALPGRTAVLHASSRKTRLRFAEVRQEVVTKLADHLAEDAEEEQLRPPAMAQALGRFLCFARKRKVPSRVVVLKFDDDVPEQYNAVMNCIFSAQRHGVTVDACVLAPKTSVLMKQAVHLTNGVFLHLAHKAHAPDLVIHLLHVFGPSPAARATLRGPLLDETDFRAACFCHDPPRVKDRGFVCSVCFAVYCDPNFHCTCLRAFSGRREPEEVAPPPGGDDDDDDDE